METEGTPRTWVSLLDTPLMVHPGSNEFSIDSPEGVEGCRPLARCASHTGPQIRSQIPVIRVKPFTKAPTLFIRGKAR